MYEFLKLVVQPVIIERNEDGSIVKEDVGPPVMIYNRDAVGELFDTIEEQIRTENAKNSKEVPSDGS